MKQMKYKGFEIWLVEIVNKEKNYCYKPRSGGSPYSKAHILMSLYFLIHIVLEFHTYVIPYIKGLLIV